MEGEIYPPQRVSKHDGGRDPPSITCSETWWRAGSILHNVFWNMMEGEIHPPQRVLNMMEGEIYPPQCVLKHARGRDLTSQWQIQMTLPFSKLLLSKNRFKMNICMWWTSNLFDFLIVIVSAFTTHSIGSGFQGTMPTYKCHIGIKGCSSHVAVRAPFYRKVIMYIITRLS